MAAKSSVITFISDEFGDPQFFFIKISLYGCFINRNVFKNSVMGDFFYFKKRISRHNKNSTNLLKTLGAFSRKTLKTTEWSNQRKCSEDNHKGVQILNSNKKNSLLTIVIILLTIINIITNALQVDFCHHKYLKNKLKCFIPIIATLVLHNEINLHTKITFATQRYDTPV